MSKARLVFLPMFFVVVSATLVARHYLSMEHAFYSWDSITYYNRVADAHRALSNLNFSGWWVFFKGFPSDIFFTIHHILFAIFGLSRDNYIIINVALFFSLLGLSISFFISRNVSKWSIWDTFFTLIISCAVPILWKVSFEGFPDAGALLFMPLALLAYSNASFEFWKVEKGNKTIIKSMILFGLFLGCAMSFRRSFSYFSLSILVVCSVEWLVAYCSKKKFSFTSLLHNVFLPWFAVLIGLFGIMLLVGRYTLKLIFRNPIDGEFLGWKSTVSGVIKGWTSDFSLMFLVLLICLYLVYLVILFGKAPDRRFKYFNLLFISTLILSMLWLFKVQFASAHYTLIIFPLAFIIAAVVSTHYLPAVLKAVVRILLVALVVLSTGGTLFPAVRDLGPQSFFSLLPAPFFPMQTEHYEDMLHIASDLRQRAGVSQDRGVCFFSSSGGFNYTILQQADDLAGGQEGALDIYEVPDVDSAAYPPVAAIYCTRFILVTGPVQYHMAKDRQKGVTFLTSSMQDPSSVLGSRFKRIHTYPINKSGADYIELYERQVPASLKESIALRNDYIKAVNTAKVIKNGRWLVYGKGLQVRHAMNMDYLVNATTLLLDFDAQAPIQGSLKMSGDNPAEYRHIVVNKNGEVQALSGYIDLEKGSNKLVDPGQLRNNEDEVYALELKFEQPLDANSPKNIEYKPE